MNQRIVVDMQPISDRSALREKWLALQQRATPNVFLSWSWIGCWLDVFEPTAELIEAKLDGKTVALGIIVSNDTLRRRVINSRQLRLHQTGSEDKDQIWIEYNGLLLDRTHAAAARQACMNYLCFRDEDWDELVLSVIDEREAETYLADDLRSVVIWRAPCYGVDLKSIRAGRKPYLETLSRNSRQQIRRAIRRYEERGDLLMQRAGSVDEALDMLHAAGDLHRLRWHNDAAGHGFGNRYFVAFHEHLIRTAFPRGEIELAAFSAGGTPFAYLYNFIQSQRVYFYLSGLSYEDDAKLKPGLVAHAMCIQRHLEEGAEYYDFMSGAARYKESLGHYVSDLVAVSYQQPRLRFRLEDYGRRFRNWQSGARA